MSDNAHATTVTLECEVLVAGGGAGGVCGAIQSARLGADTVLVEETPWLGGMLTAAGVSATDGNHLLYSGLWGEFRQKLYDHYGGPSAVNTGWVSHTLFEPSVGNEIFHLMADAEDNLSYFHGYHPVRVLKENGRVTGGVFVNEQGDFLEVRAAVSIGADECGDFLARAGVPYRIGMEARSETGEPGASPVATDIIQDMTFVATLKDFGEGADKTIPQPPDYDPDKYNCTCHEVCDGTGSRHSCDRMFDYGRLPNDKLMINWPVNGNDYYLNVLEMDFEERKQALEAAKKHTLGWIYFMQTVGGYKHLGLVTDEYPTSDNLALIPYHRESRRIRGLVRFRLQDILDPYETTSGDLYKTGIAVGDYPLDHHHTKAPEPYQESFPSIPSFAIPYGALLPKEIDGLLAAEKSISVTHIVNGCTRLQPCVMITGQAAGAAAALSVLHNVQPREIDLRELQQVLIDADCWCLPFVDATPERWSFGEIQRIGLSGALKGTGDSSGWMNKTWFYPEDAVTRGMAGDALGVCMQSDEPPAAGVVLTGDENLPRFEAVLAVYRLSGTPAPENSEPYYDDVAESDDAFSAVQYAHEQGWLDDWVIAPNFRPDRAITREQFAALLDRSLDPFHSVPVKIKPDPREGDYIEALDSLWKVHTSNEVSDLTSPAPSWFPSDADNNRDMALNKASNHLLITDNENSAIHIVDADTGDDLGELDNSLLGEGRLPAASVTVDSNGVIYAAPYEKNPFRVYRWEDENSSPTAAFSMPLDYDCGRVMDIIGTGADTLLFISAAEETGRILVLETSDGKNYSIRSWITGGDAGTPYGLYGLALLSGEEILAKGPTGKLLRYYKEGGNWIYDSAYVTPGFESARTSAMKFFPEEDILFVLAHDPVTIQTRGDLIKSATGGLVYKRLKDDTFELKAAAPLEENTESTNHAGAVAFDESRNRFFVEFSRNGYAAYNAESIRSRESSGWMCR